MIAELGTVIRVGDGYVVRGTVNGHDLSIDLPSHYVETLPREQGRKYMERSLVKVFCAMRGIDLPDGFHVR